MKVALVHDWLNGMRGGEYVLEAIGDLYPDAEIFTLFFDPENISDKIKSHKINTSYIQNLPFRKSLYRHYLPLFPGAVEKFDFGGYDLVISTSHCVAKGAASGKDTLHICYCFSPMRYVWDRFEDYFPRDRINPLRYQFISLMAKRLRSWDKRSSDRVDLFVADSNFVNMRIKSFYNRCSEVIFPPVDTEYYSPGPSSRKNYFLLAGAMVPYKKGDIVIEAFNELGIKLIVTGEGPEMNRLSKIAKGNVEFTGWIERETLRDYYRGCDALIFPGIEDFGIVPVEAQACGRPVIAFGEGGVLETVKGPTVSNYRKYGGIKSGLFFTEQTAGEIRSAVKVFSNMKFDTKEIVKHARKFSKENFSSSIDKFISKAYHNFNNNGKSGLEESMLI
jgi:glycosyltransferase involved in cell wall biosynthesis